MWKTKRFTAKWFSMWQQSLKLFRSFYHLLESLQTTAQNASSRSPAGRAHSRARGTKAALCSLCQTKRYMWTQLGLKPPRLFLIFPLTGRAEVFETRLGRPPFQWKLPPFRDATSPFKALCTWNPPITSASPCFLSSSSSKTRLKQLQISTTNLLSCRGQGSGADVFLWKGHGKEGPAWALPLLSSCNATSGTPEVGGGEAEQSTNESYCPLVVYCLLSPRTPCPLINTNKKINSLGKREWLCCHIM